METAVIIVRESDANLLEGYGADIQEAEARSWAEKRGIKVVGVERVVETGRQRNRERFDAVIAKCIQRYHIEAVKWLIFPRVDRDARNQIIFGYYLGLLCKEGMEVAFARENITTQDSPEELLILSIHAYKAEADGDTIVNNLRQGKIRRAMDDGRFPSWDGGLWPYEYIPSRKKKGGAFRQIIPERAQWCQQWYEWLKQGMKGNEIAKLMNQSGIPPARGKRWTRQVIFGILKNKGLRGKASWAGITLRPEASPAIFTEEEGDEIDRLIAINKEKARRNAHEQYELSGHIDCECGARVWGRRNIVGDHLYLRYKCYRCGRHVEKVYLESLVKTKILPLFTDSAWLRTYLDKHRPDDTVEVKSRLAFLGAQIDRKKTYLKNLKRQHAWGDWTDEDYQKERDGVKSELEKLRLEKAEAEKAYSTCVEGVKDMEAIERIADQIHERLVIGDGDALRRVYDALKLEITLTNEGVSIGALVPLEDLDVAAIASPCYRLPKP